MQSKSSERNSCMREGGCSLGTVQFAETFKNESLRTALEIARTLPKPSTQTSSMANHSQDCNQVGSSLKFFTKETSLTAQTQKLKISAFHNALWEAKALKEVHMHSRCDLPAQNSPQQWRKTHRASA